MKFSRKLDTSYMYNVYPAGCNYVPILVYLLVYNLNCVLSIHYSHISCNKIKKMIINNNDFFSGRRATTMPSMQMFGRRWLAGTDDLVFPGLLELLMRGIW